MTELKRWGDEKPDEGKSILFFTPGVAAGFMCKIEGGALETLIADCIIGTHEVHEDARWCYVPDTPVWEEL